MTQISRRAMLLSPLATIAVPAAEPARKFGRLTPRGWTAHRSRTGNELRVYVDGLDVTTACAYANDRTGRAVVYRRDRDGRFYIGPDGRPARDVYRKADVRIVEVRG